MFESLKSMGAMASLMQNRDKLEAIGARVKSQIDELRVDGAAGQGAVRATVNGAMKIVSLHLEPALAAGMAADDTTRELAQGLIADAINDAQSTAQVRVRSLIEAELEAAGLGDLAQQLMGQQGPLGNLLP